MQEPVLESAEAETSAPAIEVRLHAWWLRPTTVVFEWWLPLQLTSRVLSISPVTPAGKPPASAARFSQ